MLTPPRYGVKDSGSARGVDAPDDGGDRHQPDTLADPTADPLHDIPARIASAAGLHLGRPHVGRQGHSGNDPLLGVIRAPQGDVPGAGCLEQPPATDAPACLQGLAAQALAQRRRRFVVDLDRQPRQQPRTKLGVIRDRVQGFLQQGTHPVANGAHGHCQARGSERCAGEELAAPERARLAGRLFEAAPGRRRVARLGSACGGRVQVAGPAGSGGGRCTGQARAAPAARAAR
jgi:hypothetical protein